LIVSGVAATRGSALSVSAVTAMRMTNSGFEKIETVAVMVAPDGSA
jgi:hypothetical protein